MNWTFIGGVVVGVIIDCSMSMWIIWDNFRSGKWVLGNKQDNNKETT